MTTEYKNPWEVTLARRADKEKNKLPVNIQTQLYRLIRDMEVTGPIRRNWPNFSALRGHDLPDDAFHCHIKKGKPTYVVCWRIISKKEKTIEVFYVGTHENSPYQKH